MSRAAATSAGLIRSAEVVLRAMEADAEIAPELVAGNRDLMAKLPGRWSANTIENAEVARIWRREGRKALAVHPGIVDAVRMATSDKVPPEVFRALPYINPMVLFPDPIPMKTWRSRRTEDTNNPQWSHLTPYEEGGMRMVGFLIYGCYDVQYSAAANKDEEHERMVKAIRDRVSLSTDPEAERLAVAVHFEVLDTSGRVVDQETAVMTLPLTGKPKTLKEMAAEQVRRFEFFEEASQAAPWVTEIYKVVLGVLMYLASTTLEAEPVPASACRKVRSSILRKPISLYRVGWTTGAALDRLRKERAMLGNESQQQGLSHQQDPQHRRAHFKTVWTGPGRSIPKTAFVAPYWTRREKLGEQGVNTLHRVRDMKGKTA